MIRSSSGIGGFALASAILHVAALGGAYVYLEGRPATNRIEEASTRISLGLAASQAGTRAQPNATPVETSRPDEARDAERVVEQQAVEPPPERDLQQKALRKLKTNADPPPEDLPKVEPPPAPRSSAASVAVQPGMDGKQGASTTPTEAVETGDASDAGAKALEAAYDLLVVRRLKAEKRYPALARRRKQEGVVQLSFTIDRSGGLEPAVSVVAQCDQPIFEEAVKEQLRRSAPFPPPPEEVRWRTRSYTVNVNFSIEDAR